MNGPEQNATPKEYRIGIAGTGASFQPMLQLFTRPDFKEHFPGVRILGVADPNQGAPGTLNSLWVPLYRDVQAMLENHPDMNMILDLGDDPGLTVTLRKGLPPGVSLMDSGAAMFLWGLVTSEKLCTICQVDLSHARAFLNTVIEEMKEDILLLDKAGYIVDLNKNVYARKGKEKQSFLGLHFSDIESDNFCRGLGQECPFKKTVAAKEKAEAVYTNLDEHGRMQYFRVYTYPVFGQGLELTHVVEIRRDITRRTRMEQRLQQSEKMAAIGELSTYIAHEIRNPLFAIGGFANALLRMEGINENAREKAGIILEESKRLENILKSILNFARPAEAQAEEVDLGAVIAETMGLMRMACEEQNIRVHLDLDKDIALAKCDPNLLKQCLINMVKNSMEAMPDGGDLTVRTGMAEKNLFLTVEDTGEGIPEEIQDKVFNPFFSTKNKGAGLGLAMTRQILDVAGGGVEIKSRPGKGTNVTLFLPPVLAERDDEEDEGGE